MAVELANNISELDDVYPLRKDDLTEGSTHIRNLKTTLKAQFAGVNGNGFSKAITAIEDEINYLEGLNSNLQLQLNSITARLELLEG